MFPESEDKFIMYYVCRPRSDNQLFSRHENPKYPPIPSPWPTKNENIINLSSDSGNTHSPKIIQGY